MSMLFLDSFDNYQTVSTMVLGKWGNSNLVDGIVTFPATGRNGSSCFHWVIGGLAPSSTSFIGRTFASNQVTLIVGFAMRVDAFDAFNEIPFFQFVDVITPQVTVGYLPTGQIIVRSGSQTGAIQAISAGPVLIAGVWMYLEMSVTFDAAAGAFTMRNNGAQIIALTNINTAPSGTASANTIQMGSYERGLVVMSSTYSIDDMYALIPSGAHNTAFLGDTRVFWSFPTADGGTLNFTPSPNQAHYLNVNQIEQDGDTTYNYDANALDVDLYVHSPTPASTGTVFAVQLCQISRKDDAAARSTANYLKSGASTVAGTTTALSQSYAWYLSIIEVDPATNNPFTKAGIDAAQIGVIVAA